MTHFNSAHKHSLIIKSIKLLYLVLHAVLTGGGATPPPFAGGVTPEEPGVCSIDLVLNINITRGIKIAEIVIDNCCF